MLLSHVLGKIDASYEVLQDCEFKVLEQCTRVRYSNVLTYVENEKYISFLNNQKIVAVICKNEFVSQLPNNVVGVIVSSNPKEVFFKIHNYLAENKIKEKTIIGENTSISELAYIAPHNVIIGNNVIIEPFVVINENTRVCDDVKICAGTVVGGQSFTSITNEDGSVFLAKDAGNTVIEKGVEICANCSIACGTLKADTTIIGEYTKIDALVHIGHGTVIGKRSLIPACAAISGNCIIGDDTWIGVNATVSNRIVIGDSARVSLGSVVTKNVNNEDTVTGNFAIPHKTFLKNLKESIKE